MSGDLSAFADAITFPYELETSNSKRLYHALDEFEEVFQAVHEHLKQMRVTILARHCVAAAFRNPDEIVATHETRLISDGLLIEDPFPTLSILVRTESGAWKVRTSSYYVPDDSLYHSALDR
ncbi:hypothetical protein [uncultured Tateyamaria sp.]|uniref:hypothetical protein n=1 Tax=Tateyamaria sp. 1078 TaxID=3417464 RepID=UPI002626DC5A|nr:hypothetical protein [uncultured Tateyamaria sp.]